MEKDYPLQGWCKMYEARYISNHGEEKPTASYELSLTGFGVNSDAYSVNDYYWLFVQLKERICQLIIECHGVIFQVNENDILFSMNTSFSQTLNNSLIEMKGQTSGQINYHYQVRSISRKFDFYDGGIFIYSLN